MPPPQLPPLPPGPLTLAAARQLGLSDHQWRTEGVAAPDADRANPHRAGVGTRARGPVCPGPTGGLRVLARHCGSALGPSPSVRTGGSGGPGRDPCHRARSHRAARLHPAPRRGTARARGPRRAAGDRPRRHLGGPRGGHGEGDRHHRPRRCRGRGREPPAGGVPRRGSHQGAVHGGIRSRSRDANRNGLLTDEGWRVLEIFSEDVFDAPRRVQTLTRFAGALVLDLTTLRIA